MATSIESGSAAAHTPSAEAVSINRSVAAPHAQLIDMAIAIWRSRAVYAAAALGLADLLIEGPRSGDELASELGMHAPSLYRLLRALAACGLLREIGPRIFVTTSLGGALQSNAPGAARSTILTLAGDWQWRAWGHFMDSLRTGEPALKTAFGQSLFDFLAAHPEHGARFDEAMVGMYGALGRALLEAYDFSPFASVVDVGGGSGQLLEALLRANDKQRGVLIEQPATAALARARFQMSGLANRCQVIEGDFFTSVAPGHDAYILAHVLHDWDDAQCVSILQNCRRAVPPGGRLLIVESVLPADDGPHHGKMLDLLMLTVTGGRERTLDEFDNLLVEGGFRLARAVETTTHQSIVEAMPN
jgi:SAM-dependent methyltransferase